MQKSTFSSILSITVSILLLPSLVLAVSDPIVIEEVTKYPYGDTHLDYTVINPADSSIGDIVGFVIEVNYNWYLEASTTNGWMAQGVTNSPLSAATWDLNMSGNSEALTWRQFFGGIDYPFGDVNGVGYYVNYSEVTPDTFKFNWSYPEAPYHLPILPGETLGGFHVDVDLTYSQYLLAYIDDAENETFDDSGLSSFAGETIPEPATIAMLGLGGLLLGRSRKFNKSKK